MNEDEDCQFEDVVGKWFRIHQKYLGTRKRPRYGTAEYEDD